VTAAIKWKLLAALSSVHHLMYDLLHYLRLHYTNFLFPYCWENVYSILEILLAINPGLLLGNQYTFIKIKIIISV